jgi:hypothetical protein
MEGRSSIPDCKQLIQKGESALSLCCIRPWKCCWRFKSLECDAVFGQDVWKDFSASSSGSGSQRRMKTRARWFFRISGTACPNCSVPDDLNLQVFKHSVSVFQVLWNFTALTLITLHIFLPFVTADSQWISDLFSSESRPELPNTSISTAHRDEPSQTNHDQMSLRNVSYITSNTTIILVSVFIVF